MRSGSRNSKCSHMATSSECWYRWLRAPATISTCSTRSAARSPGRPFCVPACRILASSLEQGRVLWVQPWGRAKAGLGLPENAATRRRYSEINILILWGAVVEHGFPAQAWLTFRQAQDLGGTVRKGEHGTSVFYADRFVPREERKRAAEAGEEPQAVPFLKRCFTLFNVGQCDGLPEQLHAVAAPLPECEVVPRAEALIAATGADVRIGGNRAFFPPGDDYIQVPPQPPSSSRSTTTAPASTSSATGAATPRGWRVTSPAPSAPGPTPARSWWPRWPAPSSVPASASRPACATPTISAPGWRSCARTSAPSSAPPARPPRPPTSCSPSRRRPGQGGGLMRQLSTLYARQ